MWNESTAGQELRRNFSSSNVLAEKKPYMAARSLSLIAKDDLPVTLLPQGLTIYDVYKTEPWCSLICSLLG
jgi:hypothetical protein